jgi:hypothetical protein
MRQATQRYLWLICFAVFSLTATAQDIQNNPSSNHGNKFEQLGTILPTPNEYRTASGAPGPAYWQQRADYDIHCSLDEKALRLKGSETITYVNNSPDPLTYLWIQLDENEHDPKSDNNSFDESRMPKVMSDKDLVRFKPAADRLEGLGDKIEKITDATGQPLHYVINQTMMRVDLPAALKPGLKYVFHINWHYNISDRLTVGGRGGYEYFPGDGNYVFTMSQWYPRLAVYSDFQGWQNHQFTGRGEFALTFGNFKVAMTVPADHVVGGTGQCQNYQELLTPGQYARFQKAQTANQPVEVVTLAEAKAAEPHPSARTKTWVFQAENVRDFAWTSSRKFVWDAMAIHVEGKKVLCMSYYPKEAYALWSRYSTKVVAHTIRTYSKHTIPYPYPVAQSVEASNGMEYPMICFNNGRTEKDGTYTEATKNGMIGVIIHEVGHNFFPMIVNSDERQWTWMDEGLNTFCQYMAEQEWDNHFPSGRGPAYKIVDYMRLPKDQLEPIMTNSENIVNFGPNAYSKPCTALNILRETIMGRELFDYAFKEYAKRWAFKHPTPADFFRTMEDASAVDLDWFWRGWFYGIDPVDISLDTVKVYTVDTQTDPETRTMKRTLKVTAPYDDITKIRNRADTSIHFTVDQDSALKDFYSTYKPWLTADSVQNITVTQYDEKLDADTKVKLAGNEFFYELYLTNKGGLVMPLIIEWAYKDGTKETETVAAQVWRKNEHAIVKVFMKSKEVASIRLDPNRETADIDESNNVWPRSGDVETPSHFQLYKGKIQARGQTGGGNPMQKALQQQQ